MFLNNHKRMNVHILHIHVHEQKQQNQCHYETTFPVSSFPLYVRFPWENGR